MAESQPERPIPYVCIVCKHRPESYYGRLVFPEERADGASPPICPNHPKEQPQVLIPA